jgi:hypothetical protein
VRRLFFLELWNGLQLVWPIVSGLLAIAIGFTGILLTGLVAAIAVRALERATK